MLYSGFFSVKFINHFCWPSAPAPPPASVQTAGWWWMGRNQLLRRQFSNNQNTNFHSSPSLLCQNKNLLSQCDSAKAHITQARKQRRGFLPVTVSCLREGGHGVTLQRPRLMSSTSTSTSTSTIRIRTSASTQRWSYSWGFKRWMRGDKSARCNVFLENM